MIPLNFLSWNHLTSVLGATVEMLMRLAGLHSLRLDFTPAYLMAALLLGAMLLRDELQASASRRRQPSRRRHSGRGVPVRRDLVEA